MDYIDHGIEMDGKLQSKAGKKTELFRIPQSCGMVTEGPLIQYKKWVYNNIEQSTNFPVSYAHLTWSIIN